LIDLGHERSEPENVGGWKSLGVPSPPVMENLFKAIDRERRIARAPAAGAEWVAGSWICDAGAAAFFHLLQAGVIASPACAHSRLRSAEISIVPMTNKGPSNPTRTQ
jgi:hypothetical protein